MVIYRGKECSVARKTLHDLKPKTSALNRCKGLGTGTQPGKHGTESKTHRKLHMLPRIRSHKFVSLEQNP